MSEQIIQLLVAEKERLERVIQILQGSSPKVVDVYDDPTMPDWVRPANKKAAPAPKKKGFSATRRRKMAEGQKRRWAAINAAKAESAAPKKTPSKKSAVLAAISPTAEETEFKAKMSLAMKRAWARRKKAAKKKA